LSRVDLPYLFSDYDRHGNKRVFVRRHGRKIRIRQTPGTSEFLVAYTEALAELNAFAGLVAPITGKTTIGTFGWLTARYLASEEFGKLVPDSRATRRAILDACMAEPIRPGARETMAGCPLTILAPKHIKTLRDRKKGLPGAANNRRKYLSTLFGWAVEEGLIKVNPARELRHIKSVSEGFHSWSVEEVRQFEARHKVGTMPRLALDLMLYLGVRRGDAVRLGPQQVSDGVISFVPSKTSYVRNDLSHKPILAPLARSIAATAHGSKTFLVTSFGKPFTAKGFGNWFRDRCDEAGLKECTAHGLRKVGATICADAGASDRQLMALFDWTSERQATIYTASADKKKLAGEAARMIERRMNLPTGSDSEPR
jgi:integrase